MKTKILLSALIATALAFTLNASAHDGDDNDDGDDGDSHGSHHDCDFDGHETMNAVVALTATTNAPAGARGVAKIEAENDDGEEEAELELKLFGLNPGDYFLSLTLSDGTNGTGTNVVLGQITIGNEDEDDDENDCDGHFSWKKWWERDSHSQWIKCNWGGFTNWGGWTNWCTTNWCNTSNRITVFEAELDLPADINPADITRITLSDTNGAAILVGDLVKPATNTVINISALVRLSPGVAAPSASGTAQLQSTASRGKWKHQFNLTASGLGAKSSFKVFLNGKKIGATRSDKVGQLTIKKIPSRTPAVRSLHLSDRDGNTAAGAQF